jgi:lipase chaperone LimK
MRTAKFLLFFAGLAILLAAALVGSGQQEEPALQRAAQPRQERSADPAPDKQPAVAAANPASPAPVPGPQAELRALFERFLMHDGERPMAMIRDDIEKELATRLPQDQLAAGKALLEKYVRYRDEGTLLENAIDTAATPQALRMHIDSIRDLRARVFTQDELAGLFPAEDAYEETVLARLELRYSTLGEEEKHAQAQALEASLPPEVLAVEALRTRIVRLE